MNNYLIMKIHDKRELQNIATNHSRGVDYKNFHEDLKKISK